jgi:hypothetical protein
MPVKGLFLPKNLNLVSLRDGVSMLLEYEPSKLQRRVWSVNILVETDEVFAEVQKRANNSKQFDRSHFLNFS